MRQFVYVPVVVGCIHCGEGHSVWAPKPTEDDARDLLASHVWGDVVLVDAADQSEVTDCVPGLVIRMPLPEADR